MNRVAIAFLDYADMIDTSVAILVKNYKVADAGPIRALLPLAALLKPTYIAGNARRLWHDTLAYLV